MYHTFGSTLVFLHPLHPLFAQITRLPTARRPITTLLKYRAYNMQLPSQVLRRSRTKWTSMGIAGRGWEPPLPSACRAFLTLIVIRSLHLRRREMSNSRSNLSAGIYYLSYRLARCFFVGGNEARERKERGSGSKANARRLMARLYSPPILVDTRLGYLQ